MKIHPLIAIISLISLAFAQDCDVVDEEAQKWSFVRQKVMPLLGLALSFPAGFGPFQSLGISTISFLLDKIIPDPSQNQPDPLKELAVELSNKMDQKLDDRTIDFFTQYAGNARQFYGNYKKAYDAWMDDNRPADESEDYSLYNFYVNQMGFLEQGPNYMASSKYTYLALPQFVNMASAHLSILRDAAMIGNDHLSVTNKSGSKTDFRQQFKDYLKKYNDILVTNYNARLPQLFEQQHGNGFYVSENSEYRKTKRSQELFNNYVAYETTAVLTAFDVAARWTMLLPPDDKTYIENMNQDNIPIDVVYTRPIYSEITKCDSYDDSISRSQTPNSYCNVNVEYLKRFKDIGIPYKGLLKKIRSAKYTKPNKGPLGFTRFWFEYEDGSIYATPGDYGNDQDPRGFFDYAYSDGPIAKKYTEIDTLSTVNITYAKINGDFSCADKSCYLFTGLYFGNVPITLPPKCKETNEKLDIPDGHTFAGMYPVQNNRPSDENFPWEIVWSMEYRKNNRVDFADVTSPHAIRFPADYVKFQERMQDGDYDQMNYLLGGRSVRFPANVVFGLPPSNQGFDYNLRVYAKSDDDSMTIDGCVLARRGVQFDGFDLYDGNCQQQEVILPEKITIAGPLHLGAVEVVQVTAKAEFYGECNQDRDCKSGLKCMLNKSSNVSRCLKFPHNEMDKCDQGEFGVQRRCSDNPPGCYGSGATNVADPGLCCNGLAFVQVWPKNQCSLSCDNATNCLKD
ncbi:hypothetical protein BGX28_004071 [Mortierella sp. GBA30]|nr:hypothetical protein BGX28_004071 [Mortierella sp. GBA30]